MSGVYGLGLMGLSGMAYGVARRNIRHRFVKSLAIGLAFSITAILAMQLPIHVRTGIIIDPRAVIVGLAAAFGGLPAAVLSAVIVGLYRLQLGGMGAVAGLTGIIASAVLGQIWRRRIGSRVRVGIRQLTGLGALLSLHALSTFVLPWELASEWYLIIIPFLTVSCLAGALVMGSMIERERRHIYTEKHWQKNASTDALTGLPNRRAFLDALDDRIDPKWQHSNLLMILDIDHFKSVNDQFGHDAGDETLKAVANALRQAADPDDLICRLGGEEFAIFVPHIQSGMIYNRAERYRTSVAESAIRYDGRSIQITASIGLASRSGSQDVDLHSMMREADLALYQAKANGRNRIALGKNMHPISRVVSLNRKAI